MKNLKAIDEALTWIGTPYHHQGRVKGVGVDCGTLICEVYEKVGLMDYLDPRPYPPDWHKQACASLLKYKYVAKRDCSVRSNGCYGVWTRQVERHKKCMEVQ